MWYRLIIRLNNVLARRRGARVAPGSLLLLLPHCLQRSECDRNIIRGVNRCARCGKCDIAGLLDLGDELGVRSFVVGGGREAARAARSPDVRAIVACACEKELVDGIRAAFPKPVIAVPNYRPGGPCRDTRANAEEIRAAILDILNAEIA